MFYGIYYFSYIAGYINYYSCVTGKLFSLYNLSLIILSILSIRNYGIYYLLNVINTNGFPYFYVN